MVSYINKQGGGALMSVTIIKISMGFSDCKFSPKGTSYIGTLSTTKTGKTCQRWDQQSPQTHSFTDSSLFPDESVSAANNYCRNPGADKEGGPWCYTTDPNTLYEYCDIPLCGKSINPA